MKLCIPLCWRSLFHLFHFNRRMFSWRRSTMRRRCRMRTRADSSSILCSTITRTTNCREVRMNTLILPSCCQYANFLNISTAACVHHHLLDRSRLTNPKQVRDTLSRIPQPRLEIRAPIVLHMISGEKIDARILGRCRCFPFSK